MAQPSTYAILEDSSITASILRGLKEDLAYDLRKVLREKANEEVEKVISALMSRFEAHLCSDENFLRGRTDINLTWLLKKEEGN